MDNKELQVIHLGSGDLIRFQKLIIVFQEVFEMENRPMVNEAYLRRLLENPLLIVFAIQYKNEIVGGLTAYELPLYYSEYSEIFIYDVAIKPGFQRRRFGTLLLSALKDYCRDNGIKEFFVEASEKDEHAVHFYQSVGGTAEKVVQFNFETEQNVSMSK